MSTTTTAATTPQIYLKAHTIKPAGDHQRTVIFLHGLGDQGESFIDVFQALNLQNTKVVLPNAPKIPISVNNSYVMPGWYDLHSLGDSREFGKQEDVVGINHTVQKLIEAIDYEAAIVGHDNVVIGGFSQGSAVTQLTAARYKQKIGGVVALSGYALLSGEDEETNPVNTTDTPTLIYHGKADEVVTLEYSQMSKKYWEKRGLTKIQYFEEPNLGHSLSMKEISQVKKFLSEVGFK